MLDLCCGPGRHAVALAQRGATVTGVDRSPFLLQQARARAASEAVTVEWVQQDMRAFVRESSFDLALNLFTSFGYFEDRQDDLVVLGNLLQSLRPGGTLLLEMVSKEWLARVFQPAIVEEMNDGTLLVKRMRVVDDWSRMHSEWIMMQQGRARSFRFHHVIYSAQELKDRLHTAGFVDVKAFGNLAGKAYGVDTERLVVSGRRPDGKLDEQ